MKRPARHKYQTSPWTGGSNAIQQHSIVNAMHFSLAIFCGTIRSQRTIVSIVSSRENIARVIKRTLGDDTNIATRSYGSRDVRMYHPDCKEGLLIAVRCDRPVSTRGRRTTTDYGVQ